ncbi:MAG: hypothetical protein M3R35_08375 [Candidatus Eremiobacteraeota bacterium]|nr:hypothetical protein [Candidatus Eremiobacteraeota bacterium]
MRSLAEFVAERDPQLLGVCEIDAGDALALATRFARQWAYRGRQALFWNDAFHARSVRDAYLPFRAAKPFDRRGLLRLEGSLGARETTLFATQFSTLREQRIPELRFARAQVRGTGASVLFAHLAPPHRRFADLGYVDASGAQDGDERLFVRGFRVESAVREDAPRGLGAPLRATVAII